ncbi:protein RRP6-like 2 isoform X2 [Lycium barbarum]|uniref:protein RRP6-like 2 isoform X2 n=1 Tax=Lycium barbarum TaxID=112863 RepID=UPI00293E6B1A|nr:protein RRP6-like 2 isoform X2 [Lycium barbarum]
MEMASSEGISKNAEDTLRKVTSGPLPSTVAKLSGSSRGIPSDRDFHFYNNFSEFRTPISEIDKKSKEILEKVGALSELWGNSISYLEDLDEEESGEWLMNINDDVLEKLASSLDEFRLLRKKEEESGVKMEEEDFEGGGFQVVCRKKNRKVDNASVDKTEGKAEGVKVATKGKPKVPFHIPTIPRPQDVYKIIVNNTNQPFEHVWLQRSDDGSRFVHPLVDLEHNQYRSFQGLTCLMQISTRTEDFVVDTLKLRVHIGPHLRDIFKDHRKKKVMHGADRDIVWLQRDFGIYVCNLFDTGQASRVLKLERNSLEYLLQHFCGVTANKEYQNADWRLRPLLVEMMRYAREDTHYLLYIYDVMRMELLSSSADNGSPDAPLIEVYKRSYDICMQLYEKELLTDSSYQHIYGLQGAGFNAQQLAVVAGLHGWRDVIARAEDESTGYVLPNKTLIEIAKQMPLTTNKLKRSMKSKHPYVERNLGAVVSIIRYSVQNSAAYEAAVEHLKERRLELPAEENIVGTEGAEMLVEISESLKPTGTETSNVCSSPDAGVFHVLASIQQQNESLKPESAVTQVGFSGPGDTSEHRNEYGDIKATSSGQVEVTIQAIKKPSCGLGMLLGSTAKRKLHPDKKEPEEIQVQQIKSSVSLPFHAFSGRIEQIQQAATDPSKPLEINHIGEPVATNSKLDVITLETDSDDGESVKGERSTREQENSFAMPVATSNLEDVMLLDDDSDLEEPVKDDSEATNNQPECGETNNAVSVEEMDEGDENMALSNLSSFNKCFHSINQKSKAKLAEKQQAHEGQLKVQPFDYEAARQQEVFGEDPGKQHLEREGDESRRSETGKKKDLVLGQPPIEGTAEFQQGRRRQAFPASGNRSYTFR